MKRGAPLKRTAWKRKPREQRRQVAPHDAGKPTSGVPTVCMDQTATKTVAKRREPYALPTTAQAVPKTEAHRNSRLRDMARGMPCLLQVPGVCSHDSATVVCCHSNLSIHGKAGARKADDHYSVWGCAACHRWLDQGPAPRAQKTAAFMAAHLRQVLEWRAIAFDPGSAPRDRAAALWALDLLNSSPNPAPAIYR